jgi:hypothetical protein
VREKLLKVRGSISIAKGGGKSGASGHPIGRHDNDVATLVNDHLPQVVEQVIDSRIAQIPSLDAAGGAIDLTGQQATGLNQQRCDAPGRSRLGNSRYLVAAQPFGLRHSELVNPFQLLRPVLWLDRKPRSLPKLLNPYPVRVERQADIQQKRVCG